jgi:hypothetical protein
MPSDPIEPLTDSWPECGHSIVGVAGVTLTCTLPRHHERDGTDWHSDGTARWRLSADECFGVETGHA